MTSLTTHLHSPIPMLQVQFIVIALLPEGVRCIHRAISCGDRQELSSRVWLAGRICCGGMDLASWQELASLRVTVTALNRLRSGRTIQS